LQAVEDAEEIKARRPQAIPTEVDDAINVFIEVMEDFNRGGAVIASMGEAFDHVWASPLFVVDKSEPNGDLSEDKRVVHHQSWPNGLAVNDLTSKGKHMPSRTPTHRTLARLILYQIVRWPGLAILLAKRDCKAAFKRVFLQLASICYFATVLRALAAMLMQVIVVVWLTLTFGWTASPGEYGLWQNIIDAFINSAAPPRPEVNGGDAFTGAMSFRGGLPGARIL